MIPSCKTPNHLEKKDYTTTLPIEIWYHILGYMPQSIYDLCSLARVCKFFSDVASADVLWQPLCDPAWFSIDVSPHQTYVFHIATIGAVFCVC